jgi:hypothetical protein
MTATLDAGTIDADRAMKAKYRAMWALGHFPAVAAEVIGELGAILVRPVRWPPPRRGETTRRARRHGAEGPPAQRNGNEARADRLGALARRHDSTVTTLLGPRTARRRTVSLALGLVGTCVLAAGCSSPSSPSSPSSRSSPGSAASSVTSVSPGTSSASAAATGTDGAEQYVEAVNALCDALLPKVLAAIHGGHPDVYPVAVFFAELPAHSKLEADFDKQLARIPVPATAGNQSAALRAYIAFADNIDTSRLAAARLGQAAFDKEIRAENAEFPTDPVAADRRAAGFSESCNAR